MNDDLKKRCEAAREFVKNSAHRIEISDELHNKLEKIRKQKKLSGIGAAAEYYIEILETMTR